MAVIHKTVLLVCKGHKKRFSERLFVIGYTIAQEGSKKTEQQLCVNIFIYQ